MTRFRKKPVEVDTVVVRNALHAAGSDWDALPSWLRDAYENGDIIFARDFVSIRTKEGEMRGDIDDIIIQGVKGELYPCKPDIFVATYEPVTNEEVA